MAQQLGLGPGSLLDHTGEIDGLHEVAADLSYRRTAIVNVVYHGFAQAPEGAWTLIDTGVFGSAAAIADSAAKRFGDSRPGAILLTHGHFDHVGALQILAKRWDIPVYAHPLEFPYLNGTLSYPPADPTVGGGLMAVLSPLYPTRPVNVASHLRELPADGSVPGMEGWRWLPTPGHSPGHISLWHEDRRTLIAGDAVISTAQESVYSVIRQVPEIHGPPKYFTPDWEEAGRSMQLLAALEPEVLITGHGPALKGPEMRLALHTLAEDFRNIAMP